MGFSISWIGLRGESKDKALEALGLVETSKIDEANESPVSAATIPTGWYILFLNKFDHPFTTPDSLKNLSTSSVAIACEIEEHVMFSSACLYRDGQKVWSAVHDFQTAGMYGLLTSGTFDKEFEKIRTAQQAKQDAAGGTKSEVDYIFDIPVDAAESACGYRHDRSKFSWGTPKFYELTPTKKARFWRR
jgi:hypothetical protein